MKPQVAFFEFTSCEGCQLTVVDLLQTHPELLDAIDIVEFREASSSKADCYDIAFVEGSCTRPSDEAKLRDIRARAKIVIALGACADLGGVNAIRNPMNLIDVRTYVYSDKAEWFDTYPARPISAVIPIDGAIPGCPIDREEMAMAVTHLLQGRLPRLPDYPLCIECKLKENVCVYQRGGVCLGPITRAGCQAICPSYGAACEGCRGLVPHPNIESLKQVLRARGISETDIEAKMAIFLSYQTTQEPEASVQHGNH
ncbi:MAG: NADH:ubiquinone oxidoreductase [Anaerolineae bacterium]|nr:NADH:ubiquinone oxidoreductase [Anaerolineae bacterium]